jgi:hypothetical protein
MATSESKKPARQRAKTYPIPELHAVGIQMARMSIVIVAATLINILTPFAAYLFDHASLSRGVILYFEMLSVAMVTLVIIAAIWFDVLTRRGFGLFEEITDDEQRRLRNQYKPESGDNDPIIKHSNLETRIAIRQYSMFRDLPFVRSRWAGFIYIFFNMSWCLVGYTVLQYILKL